MRFATFTLLLLAAIPSFAAKSITVAQLEGEVASAHTEQDAAAARRLSKLELKERLDRSRLNELVAALPGDQSRAALMILADRAAFLAPAADAVSRDAAPSVEEQRRMIEGAVAYVANEIPRLPSFLAQKRTLRFEQPLIEGNSAQRFVGPLQLASIRDEEVSYRDGKEVLQLVSAEAGKADAAGQGLSTGLRTERGTGLGTGLRTWGEFGPILSVAMNDVIHNHVAWHGWELSKGGKLAVFSFEVPAKASHYTVNYCCFHDAAGQLRPFETLAGYRGKLILQPETGAILRLEMRAHLGASDPVDTADLEVNYGSVDISGRSFICPVSSVAVFRIHSEMAPDASMLAGARSHLVAGGQVNLEVSPEHTMINDASFMEYHQFRGEVRVLSEAPVPVEPAAAAQSARAEGVTEKAVGAATIIPAVAHPDGTEPATTKATAAPPQQ